MPGAQSRRSSSTLLSNPERGASHVLSVPCAATPGGGGGGSLTPSRFCGKMATAGRQGGFFAGTNIACELGSLSGHSFLSCLILEQHYLDLSVSVLYLSLSLSLLILDSLSSGEVTTNRKNMLYLS